MPNYYPNYLPTNYQYQTPQHAQQSGIVWVQGESGAKSYLMPPNTTVLLMDSEEPKFYIKITDQTGIPLPLRVFSYHEINGTGQISGDSKEDKQSDVYATKTELDAFKDEIRAMVETKDGVKDE